MEQSWTVQDMPDLAGRVAVVTGASSGIGYETARGLAERGAHVILACRDDARAQVAMSRIGSSVRMDRVQRMHLDLGSLRSIRTFVDSFGSEHSDLHLLVNNAGVMLVPYGSTEDGFERHMGVNYLGHFALTGLLLDRLLSTPGSRIVSVSSLAHGAGRIDPYDLMGEKRRYSAFAAYARSKLAILLFTQELARRLPVGGPLAVAAHPGGAATDLGRRMTERPIYGFLLPVLEWLSQSPAQASRSILRAATDQGAVGAAYYGPGRLFGMWGRPVVARLSRRAFDRSLAERLWDVSEKLTGVSFL